MDKEMILSLMDKDGNIEMNDVRIELLDARGYPIDNCNDLFNLAAILVQAIYRKAFIGNDLVESLAQTFGLVHTVSGKKLIYLEGSRPETEVYILSKATASKDYRSIYKDEIEAFGEWIVNRDLSRPTLLGSFETREVKT